MATMLLVINQYRGDTSVQQTEDKTNYVRE